jgi:phytoene dehydrogenase-like protein
MPDAVVVGAGPNGLGAAITLARAGRTVVVFEAHSTAGGGSRSAELTLPGFVHDVCSAIHPLVLASPLLQTVPLDQHGLNLLQPSAPIAHPLDDGRAAVLERSIGATAAGLGRDGRAWQRLMEPLVRRSTDLMTQILGPFRPPRHPIAYARFAAVAANSAVRLAHTRFDEPYARALLAGIAAHSMLSLRYLHSAGYALVLGMLAHAVGWPIPEGGSQRIVDALCSYLRSLGGEIVTGKPIDDIDDLPEARAYLFDVGPRALLKIAGRRLPGRYRRALARFRYGPGVFKLDWALDGPIPWTAPQCGRAGTVHVGGTMEQIAEAESVVTRGGLPDRPYVLLAQQSLFDETRTPSGKHTAWGYCHVPNACDEDMTERVEEQIERFAPGFKQRILARSQMNALDVERYNANYVGGDINGGLQDIRQLYTRPAVKPVPYSTPARDIYICSSSTPPGGGVHGMCGYWAARVALKRAW